MAKSAQAAGNTAKTLMTVAKRFLNIDLHYLGFVPNDASVSCSVRDQKPYVTTAPESAASIAILALREALLLRRRQVGGRQRGGFATTVESA